MDGPAPAAARPAASRTVGKAEVIALVRGYSIEVSPHEPLDAAAVAGLLGPARTVYVNSVPGQPSGHNLAMAARLARAGLRPVPHLAARSLESRKALADFLARATGEAGVETLLVIAGDRDTSAGPYGDSLAVLESGLPARFGIRRVGLSGYPGGHPRIGPTALREALARKAALAWGAGLEAYLVSQFEFDPAAITGWIEETEAAGCRLPIHVGLAGLATLPTLVRYAERCGVGASLRLLRGHTRSVARLLAVNAPDALIAALAAHKASRAGGNPAALHFFPFGGLARTARWLDAVLRGDFAMRPDGLGFEVQGG
jgi:methylenetetrahydrofolate reductase (NADPH)